MMKIRSIVTFGFLIVCIVFVYLVFSGADNESISADQTTRSKSSKDALPMKEKAKSQDDSASEHIIAYYFHATRRCPTCLKIEAYTEEALNEKFVEELKTGKLEWHSVNINLSENKHFVDDYQLVSQTVVLSAVQDGKQTKWKKLDKVWRLIRDREAFFSYIQTETRDFLNENKS